MVFFVYKWVLPGLFALGAALMGWFDDLRPGSTSSPRRRRSGTGPASAEDWAQLVVSGLVWLGLPLAFGIRRVLRAEVK